MISNKIYCATLIQYDCCFDLLSLTVIFFVLFDFKQNRMSKQLGCK
jgi:hypothetical protein